MKNCIRTGALFLITAAMLCFHAFAANGSVDMDYTGELDDATGEPLGESTVEQTVVPITDSISYDRTQRMFRHQIPGFDGYLLASVSDGMIVNGTVSVQASDGVMVQLFRNGEQMTDTDMSQIQGAGQYTVKAGNETVFSFNIVGKYSGQLTQYAMPSGFRILEATLDEGEVSWTRSEIDMQAEGLYKIQYECPRTGLQYDLETTVDHTPPTLKLTAVTDGVARGPVDLSDLEADASITIKHNGKAMNYANKLTKSGDYQIFVTDQAGNLSEYQFRILVYFDSNSLAFFALLVAVIGGVFAYVVWERKRLRVR